MLSDASAADDCKDVLSKRLKLSINEKRLLNKVENNMAKGEFANCAQFLLLSECFQMSSLNSADLLYVGKG